MNISTSTVITFHLSHYYKDYIFYHYLGSLCQSFFVINLSIFQ
jgi:hypothetical protein